MSNWRESLGRVGGCRCGWRLRGLTLAGESCLLLLTQILLMLLKIRLIERLLRGALGLLTRLILRARLTTRLIILLCLADLPQCILHPCPKLHIEFEELWQL